MCITIVLGAGLLRTRPITYATGRLLPFKFHQLEQSERPLLMKADIAFFFFLW